MKQMNSLLVKFTEEQTLLMNKLAAMEKMQEKLVAITQEQSRLLAESGMSDVYISSSSK